jgi:maleylacetoacetate isomerase
MRLYSYWRSSAAYRVRIALRLKGLSCETVAVDLRPGKDGQHDADYDRLNPQHMVPTLVDGELAIGQSLAIIDYLEERYPVPPLLPADAPDRARVRQIALAIAADLHPLNNLRVLRYLETQLMLDGGARHAWYHHWLCLGLDAVERLVDARGPHAVGAHVSLADVCIVPQLYNARRFGFPLDDYPRLLRVDAVCAALPAFALAAPDVQADAPA